MEAGRTQHLAVHNAEFVFLLDAVFASLHPEDRLLECSPSAFRRRWDAILQALQIGKESGLTPGGVRGGGCVHAFQTGVSLPTLLWRMRVRHLQTLESYLQEVIASTVISELRPQARQKVMCAAALAPVLIRSLSVRKIFCFTRDLVLAHSRAQAFSFGPAKIVDEDSANATLEPPFDCEVMCSSCAFWQLQLLHQDPHNLLSQAAKRQLLRVQPLKRGDPNIYIYIYVCVCVCVFAYI